MQQHLETMHLPPQWSHLPTPKNLQNNQEALQVVSLHLPFVGTICQPHTATSRRNLIALPGNIPAHPSAPQPTLLPRVLPSLTPKSPPGMREGRRSVECLNLVLSPVLSIPTSLSEHPHVTERQHELRTVTFVDWQRKTFQINSAPALNGNSLFVSSALRACTFSHPKRQYLRDQARSGGLGD